MPQYAGTAGDGEFAQSRACFEQIVKWLCGPGAAGLTHAELEKGLTEQGRELQRVLYQDRLDLQAAREERRQDVTGPEGEPRSRAEKDHPRPLVTVFGQVTVTRMAYRAGGLPNVHPADERLNLPREKHSHGLRELAALEAARGSFDGMTAAIERATGVRLGKRQAEQLARRAAADADAFYAWRTAAPADDKTLLVLQFDGKGIVMRPEALRDATARAAASRKLATRLSPGEKNGRKRMAELAAVYDCAASPRTPDDIITRPGTAPRPRAPRPKTSGKWLSASVTDDIPAVIAAGFDEAERRDPEHRRTWLVLIDGNNAQIGAVRAEAQRRGVTVHIVCDFIHVLEYLWKAARAFFEAGDPDAEEWVADRALQILAGKTRAVAAGIRRRATRFGYSSKEREGADTCAAYLDAKAPYLDYATALANGWPIATGVIEGACRHLVKDRMDITGARWSLDGAEAILKLRALTASGDFDAYWPWHLEQEHQRIYQASCDLAA